MYRADTVTDTYEPGSTLKVVTVAERWRGSSARRRSSCPEDPGGRPSDREAHRTGSERMTVASILAQSSTSGRSRSLRLLGRDRPDGSGSASSGSAGRPSRLPGRDAGILELLVGLNDRDAADRPRHRRDAGADGDRLRRGRERGVWKQPHLVLSSRVKQRRVISRAVSDQLMAMMRDVVLEGTGTGRLSRSTRWPGRPELPRSRTAGRLLDLPHAHLRFVRRRRPGERPAAP